MNVNVHRECALGTANDCWIHSFFSAQLTDPHRFLLETLGEFNKTLFKLSQIINTQFLKKNLKIEFILNDINCGKDFVYIPIHVLN